MTPSPSISQNPVQTSSTDATPDDISLGAQTTQAVHFDVSYILRLWISILVVAVLSSIDL